MEFRLNMNILQNINDREEIIEEMTKNCLYIVKTLALKMKELMHV